MTNEDLAHTPCAECGMVCSPGEYHPFLACLAFRDCMNGQTVRENLRAVTDAAEERGCRAGIERCWLIVNQAVTQEFASNEMKALDPAAVCAERRASGE